MKIIEHEGTNGKNDIATVNYEIPVSLRLVGFRSQEEYKDIMLETLRVNSTAVFELMGFLGGVIAEKDYQANIVGEWITILGAFGEGLQNAVEITEMDYERKQKAAAEGSDLKTEAQND